MEQFVKNLLLASKLHAAGFLSDEQEAKLIDNAMQKFSANTAQKPVVAKKETAEPEKSLLDAFFEVAERKELKDFLEKNISQKQDGWDDMLSTMIKNIEAQAISGHEKKKNFSDSLKQSNDTAKGKLTSQTQTGKTLEIEPDKVFSRAELANMSNDEFKKYEKTIFEQIKNGQIR